MFYQVGLIRLGLLGYVNQVGPVSVCAKFQLPSLSRSSWIVYGCGVVVWVGSDNCVLCTSTQVALSWSQGWVLTIYNFTSKLLKCHHHGVAWLWAKRGSKVAAKIPVAPTLSKPNLCIKECLTEHCAGLPCPREIPDKVTLVNHNYKNGNDNFS